MQFNVFDEYFTREFLNSKNALFNGAFSDRSDGKTFNCKEYDLDEYIDNGHDSIYVRRFKTEFTKKMYSTFLNDVLLKSKKKEKYNKYEYKTSKDGVYIRKKGSDDEFHQFIYFIPITMSGKLKSSMDVDNIFHIDFDEYIPLDNIYAPDEMNLILELWKSVDRDRDVVKFWFFGNKIHYYCPLFDYFKIDLKLSAKDTIRLYKNNTLAIQLYSSKEHRNKRSNSRFNDLVKGTAYEEYENGGILKALELKYKQHKASDECFSSFRTSIGEGTIWYDEDYNFIVSCSTRRDKLVISDKIYEDKRELVLVTLGKLAQTFKSNYRLGKVIFEDDKAFHLFEPILDKIR